MKLRQKNNFTAYMILTAVVLFFNIIISSRYIAKPLSADEQLYWKISSALIEGKNYYLEGESIIDIGTEVTPGFPMIISLIRLIPGNDRFNFFIFNIFLNILCILLFYNLLAKYVSRSISFIFALMLTLYYPLWRMNFSFLMEVTTIFFLIIGISVTNNYLKDGRIQYFYLSTFIFASLIFINNRFFFHITLIYLLILVHFIFSEEIKYLTKKRVISTYIIILLLLMPWHLRQYYHYNCFVFFTPLWTNVINNNLSFMPRLQIATDADKQPDKFGDYSEIKRTFESKFENKEKSRAEGFTIDVYNKLKYEFDNCNYFSVIIQRAQSFWKVTRFGYSLNSCKDPRIIPPDSRFKNYIDLIILLPVFIFFLIGTYYSIKKRESIFVIIFLFIISHFILHVFIHYIERYRLTILPFLFFLGAYGIHNFYLFIKKLLKVNEIK